MFQAGEAWPPNVGNSPITTRLNSAVCFLVAASAAASGVSWLLTFTPWTQFISLTRRPVRETRLWHRRQPSV